MRLAAKVAVHALVLALLPTSAAVAALSRGATGGETVALLVALALSLAVVAAVAYVYANRAERAIRQLLAASDAVAAGRLGARVHVPRADELGQVARSFNAMADRLERRFERLETERWRLREATARFAEALSSTHDVDGLLRAVVDTAVEATGASGGVILGPEGEIAHAGDPEPQPERIQLPLTVGRESFGTLVLSGDEFSVQDIESASLLVGHAAVALENARLHRIVERQAVVDALTGLANRRRAEEALAVELARADRFGAPLAFVLADLDSFKAVNDRYGHPAGDAVLREFARVLHQSVRDTDVAARWGGEEFALLLPGTDARGAVAVAERIREALAAREITTDGVRIPITASFGVASFPPAGNRAELVGAADEALYEAKRAGKDRVVASTRDAVRAAS